MKKPTPYFVEWIDYSAMGDDDEVDLRDFARYRDFPTLGLAKGYAKRLDGASPVVYRRDNIRDVTPPEDGHGLLWDWDEELETDEYA